MEEAATPPGRGWSNERLVKQCCQGNPAAWSALIEKYKNLIFSIPIKFGLSREDAADIFQAVCLDLLSMRQPQALPKWLIETSFHKCLHWDKQDDLVPLEDIEQAGAQALPEEMLYQLQRAQMLRDAMATLPPRCHRMIRMLFFEGEPRPYQEVAQRLGLATGSIGFIRGRCLVRLRKQLEGQGFK
jgi:RNA polymerase sigma factor (sigma-70 family)